MGFQITKMEVIAAKMVLWYVGIQRQVTDLHPGGSVRTKYEAVAVTIEAMLFQIYVAIKKAIPTSIYQAFNFTLLPATKATGFVTFTAPVSVNDILILLGTQVATVSTPGLPEKMYTTSASAMIPSGETSVDVPVTSTVAGSIGNTGIGTITVLKSSVSGISTITNQASIANGLDVETESERKVRFGDFIVALRRGTAGAIEVGARTAALYDSNGVVTEQVRNSIVVEPGIPIGNIYCYIYNGIGGTSDALIARAQDVINGYKNITGKKIPGYKAAGIVCTVLAATEIPQDVTIAVISVSGTDTTALQTICVTAIDSYLRGLSIGDTCLYNDLIEIIMAIDGVYDCDLTTPSANVPTTNNQVITHLGTITVTVT